MPENVVWPIVFDELVADVRACTVCIDELKDGVRPVIQVHPNAKILVVGHLIVVVSLMMARQMKSFGVLLI